MGNSKSAEEQGGIDEDAWEKLFTKLTGGSEGEKGGRTNLDHRTSSFVLNRPQTTTVDGFLAVPEPSRSNGNSPHGSRKSLASIFGQSEPLLPSKERKIDLNMLERHIMGVKESYTLEIEYGIPRSQLCRAVKKLKLEDRNGDGLIDYSEWTSYYQSHVRDARTMFPAFQVMLYQPQYSCSPPPVVILALSFLQVVCYIYHSNLISSLVSEPALSGQAPICSRLIYNPSRRYEVWRFLTYQFVHVNMEHIVFNTLMQLVVGLPLEMSQPGYTGTLKVVTVYFAGVVFGSVGGSLPNPTYYLAGASAGVYSLIAAHLATLVMNWKEDGAVYKGRTDVQKDVSKSLDPLIRTTRLAFVITFTMFDITYALYNHYSGTKTNTGYAGHFCGAIAGLLLGIVLLENRKVERWETWLRMVCISVYLGLLLLTVLWHLFGTDTGYFPAPSHSPSCQYVLDTGTLPGNTSTDHTHF